MTNLPPNEQKQKITLQEVLGQHIRILRIKKKLKQIDVADHCSFSQSGYNQIENGLRNVSIFTLFKIAQTLDVPLQKIVEIIDDEYSFIVKNK